MRGRTESAGPRDEQWSIRGRALALDRPLVMGIINVTPDSFSDGGDFFSADAAIAHGRQLLAEGADILDIGGESTRPQGAAAVHPEEEMRRVLPVIRALRALSPDLALSIDTVKAEVAAAGVEAGADIVNDVSGFRLDPEMGAVCAASGVGVILMHSRGGVSDMATYQHAVYGTDVIADVRAELEVSIDAARHAGVEAGAIAVDPGFGFAKRTEDSLAVLRRLDRIQAMGYPVVVGVSRKRFVGALSGTDAPRDRVYASIAANVMALIRGARVFRVHDVAATRHALDVAWAALAPAPAAS